VVTPNRHNFAAWADVDRDSMKKCPFKSISAQMLLDRENVRSKSQIPSQTQINEIKRSFMMSGEHPVYRGQRIRNEVRESGAG
jgi:hypothetical protein